VIRVLRKRPRADNFINEERRAVSAGRKVYLALLVLMAAGVGDYLWGDLVFLRADGLVFRDRTTIAASYLAKVETVAVREGQEVAPGDVILRLKSLEVLERLADLSARQAELVQRAADFRIRADVVTQLLPLAWRREEESRQVLSEFDSLTDRGLIGAARYEEALRAYFDAREARVSLDAERKTLSEEIPAVILAQREAAAAFADLKSHYADGDIRSPIGGSIGARAPSVGDVYRPGEPILSIYSGAPYCLVYLPGRYLFAIRVGMRVTVSNGRHSVIGEIDEILPVSDALPPEFQNTFKPQDRQQLARIRLIERSPIPVGEKVVASRGLLAALLDFLNEGRVPGR